jgi:gamma-glutamylcyclotransferase (GGCT)/AIG2-like uncharacterized protein YtfP
MSDYLFIYGTLHPEHAPEEIAAAVAQLQPVGQGTVPGQLYDLGDYPGAVVDPMSLQRISGMVFQLPEHADLWPQFDAYEECNLDDPTQSLFLRARHEVKLDIGSILTCWIYIYNGEPARRIAGGLYRRAESGSR